MNELYLKLLFMEFDLTNEFTPLAMMVLESNYIVDTFITDLDDLLLYSEIYTQ